MERGPTSESSSSSDGFEEIQQNQAKGDKNSLPSQGASFERPQAMGRSSPSHGNPITISDTMRYLASSRDYQLPVSNLPSGYRLESSFRLQSPQLQQFYPQGPIPAGRRTNGGPFADKAPIGTNWHSQNPINMPPAPLGPQDHNFQGVLLNQSMAPSGYFPNVGLPYSFPPPPNIPMQQVMGQQCMGNPIPYQVMEGFPSNANKGENWHPQVEGSEGVNYPAPESSNERPQMLRNSVYDPMYEQMGLPVDPHLRMFVARRTAGSP